MAMGKKRRRPMLRRKICRFCADKSLKVDFREPNSLRYFITERGKIIPSRVSGTCAPHQRQLTSAIKRARNIALIAFKEVPV